MSSHASGQVWRFVRTTALAFASYYLATGGTVSWGGAWTLLVGAAEVGVREAWPVKPLPPPLTGPGSP